MDSKGEKEKSEEVNHSIITLGHQEGEDQREMPIDNSSIHLATENNEGQQIPLASKLEKSIVVISPDGECISNHDIGNDEHRKSQQASSMMNISPEASMLAKGSSVHNSDISDSQDDNDLEYNMKQDLESKGETKKESPYLSGVQRTHGLSKSTIPEEDEFVGDLDTKSNEEKLIGYKSSSSKDFQLKLRTEFSEQSTKPTELTHTDSNQSQIKGQQSVTGKTAGSNPRLEEFAPSDLSIDKTQKFGFGLIKPVKRNSKLGR